MQGHEGGHIRHDGQRSQQVQLLSLSGIPQRRCGERPDGDLHKRQQGPLCQSVRLPRQLSAPNWWGGCVQFPIGVGLTANGEITIADNHNNFNLTVFSQAGQLLGALESKVKHPQCFDVALMKDGSIVLASKDYRLHIYRYVKVSKSILGYKSLKPILLRFQIYPFDRCSPGLKSGLWKFYRVSKQRFSPAKTLWIVIYYEAVILCVNLRGLPPFGFSLFSTKSEMLDLVLECLHVEKISNFNCWLAHLRVLKFI